MNAGANRIDEADKKKILEQAKEWFREEIVPSHLKNLRKLVKVNEFTVNPFLRLYLSNFLEGNSDPKSIAKALIYPRILGTSITTIFGTKAQSFVTKVFDGISGSTTQGIDIEFIDYTDGRKKYCQVKAGPNVINKDDVQTISEHFSSAKRLAITNNLPVQITDYMFCLLYGEPGEENGNVKKLRQNFVVSMGKDFWTRFTGDENFYQELIDAVGEVANEVDAKEDLARIVQELALEIENMNL